MSFVKLKTLADFILLPQTLGTSPQEKTLRVIVKDNKFSEGSWSALKLFPASHIHQSGVAEAPTLPLCFKLEYCKSKQSS